MKPAFRKLMTPVSHSFVVKTDDVPLKNPWHYHPEVELLYFHECFCNMFVGDAVERVKDGDLLLVGTNLPHTIQRDFQYYNDHPEDKPLVHIMQFLPYFLGRDFFDTEEFLPVQRLLRRAERGIKFTGPECKVLGKRLSEMHRLSPPHRILELLSILLELASSEQYQYLSSEGFVNFYAQLHHTRLNKVYEYSVNYFMEKVTIESVASLANLTPAAFCRFFKSRTGRTYLEYLTDLRISFACKLLAEDKLNISEIAYQSGFQNLSLFNRQFKEIKKITPSEYQQQFRKVYAGK
jgi:AraC-like DNA-binding protein